MLCCVRGKKICRMVHTVGKPVLGKRMQMGPWGLLLSQTTIPDKTESSQRVPHKKNADSTSRKAPALSLHPCTHTPDTPQMRVHAKLLKIK